MPPTHQQICVIGGSNSIKSQGWTSILSQNLPISTGFVNESVGGVPCILGYYRLMAQRQLKPGDVVLWEYALNDQNHIDNRGYSAELLLRFCEHTIRLCLKRGLRFIPLIFATRKTAALPAMTEYRRGLRALFAHYDLDCLDVTEELPKTLGKPAVPPFVYEDESHYKVGAFITRFIANRAMVLLKSGAGVPAPVPRLFGKDVGVVQLVTRFDTGAQELFGNSRVSVTCWQPTPKGVPVAVTVEKGPFRLVGVVMLCTSFGGAFNVTAGTRRFALSATYEEDKFTKPLLKLFTLSDDLDAGVIYPPDTRISFDWSDGSMPLLADFGFRAPLNKRQLALRESSIVGLVLERLKTEADSTT